MPRQFLSPTGQTADESEACVNGVLRDGYRLGFDHMFMDSPGRMYLTDSSDVVTASQAAMRDAARAAQNGDFVPLQRLEAAAYHAVDHNAWRKGISDASDNRYVRDLARASQY